MELSEQEVLRYARHIVLPQIGGVGQRTLKGASALVVGAGGLGSPAIYYLAAAGIGALHIVDNDVVDRTNLHRQILYRMAELGEPKAQTARRRVEAINPHVSVQATRCRVDDTNVEGLVRGCSVVLDGSDTAGTKFLLNRACVAASVPLIYAGVIRFEGQVTTIAPGVGPCLQCLFADPEAFDRDPLETCSQAGVLGAVAGQIGSLQAIEALKILLGVGDPLIGRMLVVDALDNRFRTVPFIQRPECPVCGSESGE